MSEINLTPILIGLAAFITIAFFAYRVGNQNIRTKLLSMVFLILGSVVFFQTGVNLRISREQSEQEERESLSSLYQGYNDLINVETRSAAALSLSYADRNDIKELYLDQDRDGLLTLLTPIFEKLRDANDIRHLYIENPDGTVFVRVHNPEKYGDDVTYRYTAADALERQETVAGVEVGPGRIGIRSVSPLWNKDKFIGMVEVGLDYDQGFVDDLKQRTNADYNLWITYQAAESPGLTPAVDAPESSSDLIFHYASSNTNYSSLPISEEIYESVLEAKSPVIEFISIDNEDLAVLIAPMLAYQGRVIGIVEIIQPRTDALEAVARNRRSVLIPAILLTIIGLVILGITINQTVLRPIEHMAVVAEKQVEGNLSSKVEILPRDEIGYLGNTLNTLSEQLNKTLKNQEEIIVERTKNLEERSRYLESSAEVSRAIASITDPDELINQVVNLIKERFELYYVGLFIADEENEWAILRAGTGEAGRIMLEDKHRLKVGSGMIGWSIANARARIALDVGDDAVRFENPVLPDTHSEGALPLRSRGRVLGALSIQSTRQAAFTPEIITTLQTMADQIAIALDNAELIAQSEAALEAERKAYGQLSQTEWLELLQRKSIPKFISDAPGHVHTLSSDEKENEAESLRPTPKLEENGMVAIVPVKVRGNIIGGIKLRKEEKTGIWTKHQLELAEALAEEISEALENARLFDQSQRRASQERAITEMSSSISATTDVDAILRATLRELQKNISDTDIIFQLDLEDEG